MELRDFKAIAFDFNGTIVDSNYEEIPGAVFFLKRLSVRKPGKYGLISSSPISTVSPFLLKHKLNPYIPRSRIVSLDNLDSPSNIKPHPEAYELFINNIFELKDPAQCLAIEADPEGIAAAKYAGAVVIGMELNSNPCNTSKAQPDITVSGYLNLSQILGMNQPSQS